MRIWRAGAATVLVGALALGACGTGSEPEPTDPGTGGPTEPTDPPETTEPEPEPEPTEPPDDGDLPGEVVEIYPYEGDELAVVGVEADDVLNVRSGPGVAYDVVAELPPLGDGVVATGRNRSLGDDGFWAEVDVDGVRGWANTVYLAVHGQTADVTSELGDLPSGTDLVELAEAVASLRAPDGEGEGEASVSVTVVDGPNLGDLADVTVDVTGQPDDSVLGERLQVFAADEAGTYTVRTVESTVLCRRGVTDEGLCT